MRRLVAMSLFAVALSILFGCPPMAARAASASPSSVPSVVVASPTLNLRAGPRLSAPVVRVLPRGTVLRVRFYHVSWIAVTTSDNTIGYVDRYDVRPLSPAAPSTPATPTRAASATARVSFRPPYLTVAVAAVNLRAAPARTAPVVAVLPRLTPLSLLSVDGTWARVTTRAGRVGWVALYLTRPV